MQSTSGSSSSSSLSKDILLIRNLIAAINVYFFKAKGARKKDIKEILTLIYSYLGISKEKQDDIFDRVLDEKNIKAIAGMNIKDKLKEENFFPNIAQLFPKGEPKFLTSKIERDYEFKELITKLSSMANNMGRGSRLAKSLNQQLHNQLTEFKKEERETVGTDQLPDEVLLKIFSELPPHQLQEASNVSRRFQRLSRDHSLWKPRKQKSDPSSSSELDDSKQVGLPTRAHVILANPSFDLPDFTESLNNQLSDLLPQSLSDFPSFLNLLSNPLSSHSANDNNEDQLGSYSGSYDLVDISDEKLINQFGLIWIHFYNRPTFSKAQNFLNTENTHQNSSFVLRSKLSWEEFQEQGKTISDAIIAYNALITGYKQLLNNYDTAINSPQTSTNRNRIESQFKKSISEVEPQITKARTELFTQIKDFLSSLDKAFIIGSQKTIYSLNYDTNYEVFGVKPEATSSSNKPSTSGSSQHKGKR